MILSRLRQETRPQHDAIEAELNILDRPLDRDSYCRLLAQFAGYYEPIERRLAEATDWQRLGFDYFSRRKLSWLIHDLEELGLSWSHSGLRCAVLPDLATPAQALGCLYVLEGSTLGGQIITRHLHNAPKGPYPTHFFSGYGDETGRKWKEFGSFLTQFAEANPADDDSIVQAATTTFTTLTDWLRGERVER
jgi:heme oxygenase